MLRTGRLLLRLLPALVLLVLVVPGSAVRPATMSLTKVESANGYDAGADVVWVLVLGVDGEGLTDAIQLLGIDSRTGAAAAIGFPRDTWVDLGGGQEGKINEAFRDGADSISRVVEGLVGIRATYVLATRGAGFVSMVDELGGVTVHSDLQFTTDTGELTVRKGRNDFTGHTALLFAETRIFGDAPSPDFIRVGNHQDLLLGLLAGLQERDDGRGFVETMALRAIEDIDTEDVSPLDLYRLLNALTSVDPARAEGCVLVGSEDVDDVGNQIIRPDVDLADRLGRDAVDDAAFDSGCDPEGS